MDNKEEVRNRPGTSKRREIVNKRNDKESSTDLTKSAKNEEPCKNKTDSDGEKSSLNCGIFSNYLLLRGIFKHLDFYSLKSCRQINHLWNLEATPIFLRNFTMDSITLNEDHLSLSRNWRKTSGDLKLTGSYGAFQQLLSHSTEFPCKNFRMDGRKMSDSMYDFLRVNGSIVKSFTFVAHDAFAADSNPDYEHDYDSGSETDESVPSSNEILLFLASHMPNLEILKLKQKVCTKMLTTSDSHKLKKLHTIHLECEISKEFLLGLLGMTMGSLKNIYLYYNVRRKDAYFSGLRVLIDLNLIPLLRNISLHIVRQMVDLIERILNQNPTFEKVYLMPITGRHLMNLRPRVDWPKVSQAVDKIVENSSTSVTHISNSVCSRWLTLMDIPFPKTHSFKVARQINPPRFTPMVSSDSLSIPEIFPNLKTFEFVYPNSLDHIFGSRIFLSWTPLLSVRNLKITNVGDFAIKPMWIYIFLDLFPSITSATFACLNVEASSLIFNFRQLKTLEIMIMIKAGKENTNFPAMDSMITGFSQEAVLRLCRKVKGSLNLEESCIRAMRVNPSIVDLKGLEELYIDVRDGDDSRNIRGTTKLASVVAFAPGVSGAVFKVRDKMILSHVSRRFGFDMCPKLKSNIIINYDSMKSFRMKK